MLAGERVPSFFVPYPQNSIGVPCSASSFPVASYGSATVSFLY